MTHFLTGQIQSIRTTTLNTTFLLVTSRQSARCYHKFVIKKSPSFFVWYSKTPRSAYRIYFDDNETELILGDVYLIAQRIEQLADTYVKEHIEEIREDNKLWENKEKTEHDRKETC